MHPPVADRNGLLAGTSAYLLWGLFPLYFTLLEPTEPTEIIAHRVLWSLVFCLVALTVTRGFTSLRAVLRSPRTTATLACASVLLATNWLVYVHGVLSGHTVDAALGYYVNPLVTVLLGVVILGERLRRAQWVALGIATCAVVVITAGVGGFPWIAVALAGTFASYGLLKNRTGRAVGALAGLTVETASITPLALAYLVSLSAQGTLTFGTHGPAHTTELAALGIITAVPLLLFAGAARRLPLSVMGLLQYLTPTIQFVIAVVVFEEEMPAARWWGFALVWIALVVMTVDRVRVGRVLPEPDAAEPTAERSEALQPVAARLDQPTVNQ
jgi:chloramphenicol-sensitive protein RarD